MGDEKPKGALATVAEHLSKPVYEDALQPVAKETGQALGAAGSFLRLAVRPFQSFALGLHLGFDWLDEALRGKFEGVPPEKIVEPPPNVAGPLMLAAGFTSAGQNELRNLYAQLLATAMHADKQDDAHPAFVEMLRQLTPREAVLLKLLAVGRTHAAILAGVNQHGKITTSGGLTLTAFPDQSELSAEQHTVGLGNLERLGLIETDFDVQLTDASRYELLKTGRAVRSWDASARHQGIEPAYSEGVLRVTPLGQKFIKACLDIEVGPMGGRESPGSVG